MALALIATNTAAAQSLHSMWRARALDSVDRLKATAEKIRTAKHAERRRLILESQLDWAFANLLDERLDRFSHSKTTGGETFRLAFKSDEGDLFAITYLYISGREKPMLRVNALPRGWGVLVDAIEGAVVISVGPEEGGYRYTFIDVLPFEPSFDWDQKKDKWADPAYAKAKAREAEAAEEEATGEAKPPEPPSQPPPSRRATQEPAKPEPQQTAP